MPRFPKTPKSNRSKAPSREPRPSKTSKIPAGPSLLPFPDALNSIHDGDFPDRMEFDAILRTAASTKGSLKKLFTRKEINQGIQILSNPNTDRRGIWSTEIYTVSVLPEDQTTPCLRHHRKKIMVSVEDTYDLIRSCHSDHFGRDKTIDYIHAKGRYVLKGFVEQFLKMCPVCVKRNEAMKVSKALAAAERRAKEESESPSPEAESSSVMASSPSYGSPASSMPLFRPPSPLSDTTNWNIDMPNSPLYGPLPRNLPSTSYPHQWTDHMPLAAPAQITTTTTQSQAFFSSGSYETAGWSSSPLASAGLPLGSDFDVGFGFETLNGTGNDTVVASAGNHSSPALDSVEAYIGDWNPVEEFCGVVGGEVVTGTPSGSSGTGFFAIGSTSPGVSGGTEAPAENLHCDFDALANFVVASATSSGFPSPPYVTPTSLPIQKTTFDTISDAGAYASTWVPDAAFKPTAGGEEISRTPSMASSCSSVPSFGRPIRYAGGEGGTGGMPSTESAFYQSSNLSALYGEGTAGKGLESDVTRWQQSEGNGYPKSCDAGGSGAGWDRWC